MRTFKQYRTELSDITEAVNYHIENNIPLTENIFRPYSDKFFELFREARKLYQEGNLIVKNSFEKDLLETEIGDFAEYEGEMIPLDIPCVVQEEDEKNPPLNKPKRGGPKKYYVYVRKPDGGIKKVTWGDTTGLNVKINDPKARKNFAARHRCSKQNDRTTAAYWACNLPKYAKSLGLSGGGNFYW